MLIYSVLKQHSHPGLKPALKKKRAPAPHKNLRFHPSVDIGKEQMTTTVEVLVIF